MGLELVGDAHGYLATSEWYDSPFSRIKPSFSNFRKMRRFAMDLSELGLKWKLLPFNSLNAAITM
jgi:hypothetical protein